MSESRQVRRARERAEAKTVTRMTSSNSMDGFQYPDESLMDTSMCPVGDACTSCGSKEDLRRVASVFSSNDGVGWNIACTTRCESCNDGRSFMTTLGLDGLHQALAAHEAHLAAASR